MIDGRTRQELAQRVAAATPSQQAQFLLERMKWPLVIAQAAGVTTGTVHRWAAGAFRPTGEHATRLSEMFAAVYTLAAFFSEPHVPNAWVIGANPWIGEHAPLAYIRAGRGSEVLVAAQGFVEYCQEAPNPCRLQPEYPVLGAAPMIARAAPTQGVA